MCCERFYRPAGSIVTLCSFIARTCKLKDNRPLSVYIAVRLIRPISSLPWHFCYSEVVDAHSEREDNRVHVVRHRTQSAS
jgi:hypothetical protein